MRKINWSLLLIGIILESSLLYLLYKRSIFLDSPDNILHSTYSRFEVGATFLLFFFGLFFIIKPLQGHSTKSILTTNIGKYKERKYDKLSLILLNTFLISSISIILYLQLTNKWTDIFSFISSKELIIFAYFFATISTIVKVSYKIFDTLWSFWLKLLLLVFINGLIILGSILLISSSIK